MYYIHIYIYEYRDIMRFTNEILCREHQMLLHTRRSRILTWLRTEKKYFNILYICRETYIGCFFNNNRLPFKAIKLLRFGLFLCSIFIIETYDASITFFFIPPQRYLVGWSDEKLCLFLIEIPFLLRYLIEGIFLRILKYQNHMSNGRFLNYSCWSIKENTSIVSNIIMIYL